MDSRYERSGVSLSFVRRDSWLPAHNANGIRAGHTHPIRNKHKVESSYEKQISSYIYRHYSGSMPMLLLEFPYTRTHLPLAAENCLWCSVAMQTDTRIPNSIRRKHFTVRRNTCHNVRRILPNECEKDRERERDCADPQRMAEFSPKM